MNAIAADNSPVTALVTADSGMVYGATSGKTESCLFLYDRAINKVRTLGHIEGAKGVHHALVQDSDGTLLIGGGLNMLAPVKLTREFPGGFRAIERQLWKDIAAPYAGYEGGRLYRYDPQTGDAGARLPGEACPLKDMGVPVNGNTVYALALDAAARVLYGITYPDARFFAWDLKRNKTVTDIPLLERKIFSGPERHWRSVPRALHVAADGRVYTSGEDGRVVYYDPADKKIVATDMQIPGEYHEAFNYYGYPVLEAWQAAPDGSLYGATTDGYLFRLETTGEARNKSKSHENLKYSSVSSVVKNVSGFDRLVNLGKPRLSRRVRGMTLGPDNRLYMICGEFEEPCKLFSYGQGGDGGRPYILRFSECKKVRVSGLLFLNSARWLSHFLACEDVLIERVAIRSRIRENRDGIDVDSCDGVVIRDCDIYVGDDAIVLKATVPGRPCRDVRVSACRLSSLAAALKLGTESQGGYEDIVFQDCFLYDTRDGICVEEVDGGVCRRVNVSDIVMRDVDIPIFVRLGNRGNPVPGHPKPGMGKMSDITISNVRADNAGRIGCSVTGIPGHPVERVTLRNIKIRFSGGGTKAEAERAVPVKGKAYPRGGMFGVLPAFGLYVRHVEGIALHDLDLQFAGEDARPAIVIDTGVAGVKISGVTPQPHKR